ncbi:MAG: hypothetical protein NTW08_02600 [Gammaproteobacteria bacterium]|nr:hypothetical protein [Gammaproteobacteria bacterium]
MGMLTKAQLDFLNEKFRALPELTDEQKASPVYMKFRKDLELEVKALNVTEDAVRKELNTEEERNTYTKFQSGQSQIFNRLCMLMDHVQNDCGKAQIINGDQEGLKAIRYANQGMEAHIKGNLDESKALFKKAGNMAEEAANKSAGFFKRNWKIFAAALFAVALVLVCVFVPPVGVAVLGGLAIAGSHVVTAGAAVKGVAVAAGAAATGNVVATAAIAANVALVTGIGGVAGYKGYKAQVQEARTKEDSRASEVQTGYDKIAKAAVAAPASTGSGPKVTTATQTDNQNTTRPRSRTK